MDFTDEELVHILNALDRISISGVEAQARNIRCVKKVKQELEERQQNGGDRA